MTGLLWGGAVRIFLLHHVTFSINSLCHFVGRRPFVTSDESSNVAWLAPLAFGEAWHNNLHGFPTSARHGLGRWQLDPAAWLISALERTHLAWDVVRISPQRCAPSATTPPAMDGVLRISAGPGRDLRLVDDNHGVYSISGFS